MDETPEDLINRELGPKEKLLWMGRPRQGLMLRETDAFLIPFSLFWGGFAIFWEVNAIAIGGRPFLALFGVPFVLVGAYVILGRFWVDAAQRARMLYAVTNERVIIISGLFARRVQSLNVHTLADLSLLERKNGSGAITFGPVPPDYPGGGGYGRRRPAAVPTFELADDVRSVYEVIRQAQQAAWQSV